VGYHRVIVRQIVQCIVDVHLPPPSLSW
jgi:hypothetical protein